MANITVSFNEKRSKEAELKKWLDEEDGPTATIIKDKLYEYMKLTLMIKTLKDLSTLAKSLDKLPELAKLLELKPATEAKQQESCTAEQP